MIPLSVIIKRERPVELIRSETNKLVRESLIEAANYWLVHYRPLHFAPSAVQRYAYMSRSRRYLKMKRTRDFVKVKGKLVRIAKPAGPLVLTGSLRDSILRKSPSDFRIIARATSNRQTVRINLPTPHPLKYRGELGRLVREEIEAMNKQAVTAFRSKIAAIKGTSVKRLR